MYEPIVACAPIKRTASGQEGVLMLELRHSVDRVWAAITDPANLTHWLAAGDVDLRSGGSVRLDFHASGTAIDSKITAFDPPWVLEYSWSSAGEPERPLYWLLEERPGSTRLILTVSLAELEDGPKACAGWAAHLEMLAAFLEGVPINFPSQQFRAYRAHLAALED